jgi:hypothetical protein
MIQTIIHLSESQFCDFDANCHKHGGTQKMVIQDGGSSLVIILKLSE